MTALFAVYFATAKFGLNIDAVHRFATLVWLPTGIAFSALVLLGLRFWPPIFLGAFFVNWVVGAPLLVAVGIGAGNALEAVAGAWLCLRLSSFHRSLDSIKSISALVIFGSGVSTLISATVGVGSLWLGGVLVPEALSQTWLQWWSGDAMGDLFVAPFILMWCIGGPKRLAAERPAPIQAAMKYAEVALFGAALVALSVVVLSGSERERLHALIGFNGIYALLPPLIWASIRFGQRGGVLGILAISGIAIWFATHRLGPFAPGGAPPNPVHVLTFVIVVALTGLTVGAVVSQFERAALDAQAAGAAKSSFLANMSHEIRTPLGAMLGFSDLLATGELSEADRGHAIDAIQRNGALLSGIINDILDFSKVEAGKLEIEKSPTSMRALLADLSSSFEQQAKVKGLGLVFHAAADAPAHFLTDALRLRQVLTNLLSNAIKFTERGAVELRIEPVPSASGRPALQFSVIDTGLGLSRAQVDRLFSPFMQADASTTRKFGGTGLGLALSKRLARALGGDLWLARSAPGIGSEFIVAIDCEECASLAPAGPSLHLPSLTGIRILIVDDSSDNRTLITRILNKAGAETETAKNGLEGLAMAKSGRPFDAILMDLQMPLMDGLAATKALRSAGYRQPVIALTAHALEEERRLCLENGFNEHLTKPIDRPRLLGTLAALIH